jgi:murein L,D-transpeptidase YafK
MRLRAILLSVSAVILAGIVGVATWDFSKLGRTIPPLAAPEKLATLVVVEKQARRLTLLHDGDVLKTYNVALGSDPVGPKQQEGDGRTPEGRYKIDFKHPRSRFHLALRVSYPSDADRARAQQRGVAAGSDIMIHGQPNGLGPFGRFVLGRDWTDGCVAVANAQIEEIWAMVDLGTPIEIRP